VGLEKSSRRLSSENIPRLPASALTLARTGMAERAALPSEFIQRQIDRVQNSFIFTRVRHVERVKRVTLHDFDADIESVSSLAHGYLLMIR
jgi:hypothetical protein